MALINLTKEFANGYLEFGLPGLTDGFFKILVSAQTLDIQPLLLRLELNAAGPRHFYRSDEFTSNPNVPGRSEISTSTNLIPLASGTPSDRGATFSSEILITLNPAIDLFAVQARTNSYQSSVGPIDFKTTIVSGGRAGMETLHSIGLGIDRGNGHPGAGISGWARLFYYPHLVNLQAEI